MLKPNTLTGDFPIESPPFDQIEIQVAGWCNRSCSFCPSSALDMPKKLVSLETVRAIVDQLEQRKFSGTIGLHLMCEPFLHKQLETIIETFRTRLPDVYIRAESNGDVLDGKFDRLARCFSLGLNEILLNCYDSEQQFASRCQALSKLTSKDSSIWFINEQVPSQPNGPRKSWKMVRLRAFYKGGFTLRNWAGLVGNSRDVEPAFPLSLPCSRPFNRIHVNYLGQVILCNNDWTFSNVFGDLNTQSIDDIWNAPLLLDYRRRLRACDRSKGLCAKCDSGLPMTSEPGFPPVNTRVAFLRGLYAARRKIVGLLRHMRRTIAPTLLP